MRSRIATLLAAICLASCTQAQSAPPAAAVQISWEEINEMVEAFGYEQGIRTFCEDAVSNSQNAFLAELEMMSGVNPSFLERAKMRAGEVQAEFDVADPSEEQEYVCTVEMFIGSEERADLARQKWLEIKDLMNE